MSNLCNIGDLTLLYHAIHELKALAPKSIKVWQWMEPGPDIVRQLDAWGASVVPGKKKQAIDAATGALIVFSGGQIVRNNVSMASLVGLNLFVRRAFKSRGTIAMIGCGVGKIDNLLKKSMWRDILARTHIVTVRDPASAANFIELMPSLNPPAVTADLAFLPSSFNSVSAFHSGKPHIVIAPCMDRSEGRGFEIPSVCDLAIQACDQLKIPRIAVLAHDVRDLMDKATCEKIADLCRGLRPDLDVGVIASHSFADYAKIYASAGLVLTNRLHAIIFSMLAHRPVAALDDGNSKIKELSEHFFVPAIPAYGPALGNFAEIWASAKAGSASPQRRIAIYNAMNETKLNFDLIEQSISLVAGR